MTTEFFDLNLTLSKPVSLQTKSLLLSWTPSNGRDPDISSLPSWRPDFQTWSPWQITDDLQRIKPIRDYEELRHNIQHLHWLSGIVLNILAKHGIALDGSYIWQSEDWIGDTGRVEFERSKIVKLEMFDFYDPDCSSSGSDYLTREDGFWASSNDIVDEDLIALKRLHNRKIKAAMRA